MGWSIGYDPVWERDIGYGVPALCDHPGCGQQIDRGMAYICEPDHGGCGLFFCSRHRIHFDVCERCAHWEEPFDPTPDVAEWVHHKLTHPSWQQWRDENPSEVAALRQEYPNE